MGWFGIVEVLCGRGLRFGVRKRAEELGEEGVDLGVDRGEGGGGVGRIDGRGRGRTCERGRGVYRLAAGRGRACVIQARELEEE